MKNTNRKAFRLDPSTGVVLTVLMIFLSHPWALRADELQYNFTGLSATPTQGSIANATGGSATIGNSFGTVATPISTTSPSSVYTIPAVDNGGTAGTATGGGNIGQAVNNATTSLSLTASPYYQFTLVPTSGYAVTVSDLDFGVRSTSTGAKSFAVYASSDNFATSFALSTGTITADSTWRFQDNTSTAYTGTAGATVTLRLYVFNGASNAGSGTINTRVDDVVVLGSAAVSGSGGTGPNQYFDLNSTVAGSGIANNSTNTFSGTHFNNVVAGTNATAAFTNDGTATATFSAGTDSAANTYTVNIDTAVMTKGISFTDANVTLANAAGGSLTLTGPAITVATGSTATISQAIGGAVGLNKVGAGSLTLSGVNTYTGGTSANGGVLSISADTNLGDSSGGINLGGGTLQTTATITTGRTLDGSGSLAPATGTTFTINGAVGTTTAGALTLSDAGTVVFNGTTNTLNGLSFSSPATLNITGGTLALGTGGITTTQTAGTATVGGAISLGTASRTFAVADGTAAVDLLVSGALTGSSTLTKSGAGILRLGGDNSGFTGTFTIGGVTTTGGAISVTNVQGLAIGTLNFDTGTVSNDSGSALTTSANVSIGAQTSGTGAVLAGSAISLTGNTSIYAPAGSTTQQSLVVNNTTTIAGVFNKFSTATGSTSYEGNSSGLTFSGAGTLNLTGANTFTSPITVSGLTVNAGSTTGKALGSNTALNVVNSGTLTLTTANQVLATAPIGLNVGTLAINANQGSGATLSGGVVTGTSTVGLGALTLTGNSTLNYPGTAATAVFGSFAPGSFTLNVTGSNFGTTTDSVDGTNNRLIFNTDIQAAGFLGDVTFNGVADAVETPLDSGFYEITPNLTAVPEPTTVLGGMLLIGAAGWSQRRWLRGLIGSRA